VKFGRPSSLRGMLVAGFVLVTLPLLLAASNAALQMNHLAKRSASLVHQGVESTRHVQSLAQVLSAMQRRSGLWLLTQDPSMQAAVAEQHAALDDHLQALLRLRPDPVYHGRLEQLQAQAKAIANAVALPADDPTQAAAVAGLLGNFEPMILEANDLATANALRTSEELAALQAATEQTQQELLLQAATLIPVTALLALLFVMLLVRPLKQIDRAITELGSGQFDTPIAISGPTDLEQLGQQLEWLRTRLVELEEEKNRFLRHMSHELKTPLANLREGTELLMEGAVGDLDPAQREVTAILRENGIRLQRMIENLLSFSAWAAKGGALELSEFRLRPLVKSVMDSQQLTLVGQRLRLDLKVPDVDVTADRGKLRLILDNLLSNAVKYTPKHGTIHLWFRQADSELVIDCGDSGPGVLEADRTRIFEAFYTGAKPPGGHVPGTGIGLSVVMDFVKAHGGTIVLVDGEFPGAHFRISLPMRSEPSRKLAPDENPRDLP
jgi:two-component system sensor histidine kinase GlrK